MESEPPEDVFPTSRTYGEPGVRQFDVTLELAEAGAVPVQVDVVEEAAAAAGIDHLLKPVKAYARVLAGGDGRERLLDGEGVDVLFVPGCGLAGRNAVDVGLVEREDGLEASSVECLLVRGMGDLLAQPCCC